jgi:pyrimidine operon attenuation protein / uracil phosphoribosyltransferase
VLPFQRVFKMGNKKYILSKETAAKKLNRMALEVAERNYDEKQLIFIGIRDHGLVIAQKVAEHLKTVISAEIIVLDLSLDKIKPSSIALQPTFDFNDKVIVLIDDVANSGKTMLYALKPLLEFYPKKIQTMALVDRTHKTFPIEVDYVGISISTTTDEHIFVEVENNEVTGAYVV